MKRWFLAILAVTAITIYGCGGGGGGSSSGSSEWDTMTWDQDNWG
ncbi:hypothetical protein WCX49_05390 [Sulfurimonas sp. HSL-1656]